MKRSSKSLLKKVIAVVVVVAMLQLVGVSNAVLIFLTAVGFLVWRVARRSEDRETQHIFKFYLAADEMLRDAEREWYAFEVGEVVDEGERILNLMPDPPALCYFAVGALCHRMGDYDGAIQHLTPIIDEDWLKQRRSAEPSPQLRRYVDLLRRLEREPAIALQALSATRSLERMCQKHAGRLLLESRQRQVEQLSSGASTQLRGLDPTHQTLGSINAPPPIADVLHDVYNDEHKPC